MNYALDALWWRLRTPAVRDLASLLTAPAPWLSDCELPVRTLLGDTGLRLLLALDDAPAPLLTYLSKQIPAAQRLGMYAETLLAFWFTQAAHAQLLAHNLTVRVHGQTVGAADFVVRLNGDVYHLELACKYYGSAGRTVADFVGLNRQDGLADKVAKIQQQLSVSACREFGAALRALGVAEETVRRATIVRGMVFVPTGDLPSAVPFNRLAWQGVWGCDWVAIQAQLPSDAQTCHFAPVARLAQLSPLRLPKRAVHEWDWVQTVTQGMVAVLQRRADGFWHEVLRLMKVAIS